MEKSALNPRQLPYRFYYRWYAWFMAIFWLALAVFLGSELWQKRWPALNDWQSLWAIFFFLPGWFFFYLHPKLTRRVQIYPEFIRVSSGDVSWDLAFNDIAQIMTPIGALIGLKMNDGHVWWFSSSLERPDYLWEGLYRARPELFSSGSFFEEFRLKLVQYDHHEKRKEQFFKKGFLDFCQWLLVPVLILGVAYWWQTQDIVIHSDFLYFFRLTMYTVVTGIFASFAWSSALKKWVFDKRAQSEFEQGSKRRDMVFEQAVLKRSKFAQMATTAFLMALVVGTDINMYSLTNLKKVGSAYQLGKAKALIVDNRYNCADCAYSLKEGDVILFGRGTIGKVFALPGEVIAQTKPTGLGRSIASESILKVPAGHIALKTGPKADEVVMVKLNELVGKFKTP